MEIIRLEEANGEIFERVVEWNYGWWGKNAGKTMEQMRYLFSHMACTGNRLPQTFVALLDGIPVGMYQLSMTDDLFGRPDIYPWLINVFVDQAYRGRNICKELMLTVPQRAKEAGIDELFLYTSHVGLYEKFGWELVEMVKTFKEHSPLERLYKLKI